MGIKMKKIIKKIGIGLAAAALIMVCAVLVYVGYVYVSYKRLPDMLELEIEEPVTGSGTQDTVKTGVTYRVLTYNIGFGAYTPEFSFFMDGGKSSVGESRESVIRTVTGAADLAAGLKPDFAMFEEVDRDSTRSYHMDQKEILDEKFGDFYSDYAQNYDSAFLFYPILEPHGKSRAGITLYSAFPIESAVRRSFPISTSFSKFFDLDRCYSVSRIPVENGKYLCLYAIHMSAYGNSDTIREGQIRMLCEDMAGEYAQGNYVICGGDFNHDLKALTDDGSERESWAYPFPREELPEGFSFCLDSFSQEEREQMWNSARNADMEYAEGVTYTVTLDGFILSDNVVCEEYTHVKTGYLYSDHDPVILDFSLKGQEGENIAGAF